MDADACQSIRGSRASQPDRRFIMEVTRHSASVSEAMRLRWRVFIGEMNPGTQAPHDGFEYDRFDPYCDHLLVRDRLSGEVVGTYRILDAEHARAAGGFYSETEFGLEPIRALDGRIMEVGRACVDPDYRAGAVISILWSGLFKYILTGKYDYVIGCGSIPLGCGGCAVSALCRRLVRDHSCPPALRVAPHRPFRLDEFGAASEAAQGDAEAAIPPLIKGYLRLGAWVCGEPAWDPVFNSADLLIMLPAARINRRYSGGDPLPRPPRPDQRGGAVHRRSNLRRFTPPNPAGARDYC